LVELRLEIALARHEPGFAPDEPRLEPVAQLLELAVGEAGSMLSRRRSAAADAERPEGDEEAGAGADPGADADEERHVRRRGGGRCRRLRREADRRIRASLEAAQRRQP